MVIRFQHLPVTESRTELYSIVRLSFWAEYWAASLGVRHCYLTFPFAPFLGCCHTCPPLLPPLSSFALSGCAFPPTLALPPPPSQAVVLFSQLLPQPDAPSPNEWCEAGGQCSNRGSSCEKKIWPVMGQWKGEAQHGREGGSKKESYLGAMDG